MSGRGLVKVIGGVIALFVIMTSLFATLRACAAEIEPLVLASHVSDPTTHGNADAQTNFLGAGVTVTAPKVGLEIDLALGVKRDLHYEMLVSAADHEWISRRDTWAGSIQMRWHPGRGAK